jgi:hypothetical protein
MDRFVRVAIFACVLMSLFGAGAINAGDATPTPAWVAPATGSDRTPAVAAQIAPGTKITLQNWQQYQQYMPDGMVDLFAGKYFWKMLPTSKWTSGQL